MKKLLLLLMIIGGGGYYYYIKISPGKDKPPISQGEISPPVRAISARRADMALYRDALGTVIPLNSVIVRPRIDGQLKEILFRDGQKVKSGAILAEIDQQPFQLQLNQITAQFARDEVMLQNAQADLTRYRDLEKRDAVAKQQLDTQINLVRQYQATLKVDQAQIENARLLLSYCGITASISGKIGLRKIDAGNLIHTTDTNGLAVINQIQPIAVVFSLPEENLPQIIKSFQTESELPVEAWDNTGNKLLAQGKLDSFDNQIDPATGTIKLKALFANHGEELFPNQFVKTRLRLEIRRASTIIPTTAIQYGTTGATLVYILNPDNTVAVRNINIGPSEGDQVIIDQGINPGEKIIIDGIDKLRAGMQVTVAAQD